jgi:hypothetical protein
MLCALRLLCAIILGNAISPFSNDFAMILLRWHQASFLEKHSRREAGERREKRLKTVTLFHWERRGTKTRIVITAFSYPRLSASICGQVDKSPDFTGFS